MANPNDKRIQGERSGRYKQPDPTQGGHAGGGNKQRRENNSNTTDERKEDLTSIINRDSKYVE